MNIKEDLVKLSRLTLEQVELVTCLECCELFKSPRVATCGHTLCQSCWRGRRSCPHCSKPFDRRELRLNQQIQTHTEHVKKLRDSFEKLFNINLTEFLLEASDMEVDDPTKNVKQWLASSQNHFSGPVQSSERSSQELQNINPLEVSSNKIQIHTSPKKGPSPEKVLGMPIPQDDWDKIEVMPDTKEKNKENVVGPMDIEPFNFEDDEYTVKHPRRSSRKRELKDINDKNDHSLLDKHSSKDSSGEIDKKSNKTKQTWNNVKRMRKEFSKLNQKTRNKLNVSIEMCKKAQSTAKQNIKLPQAVSMVYDIDENTPDDVSNIKQKDKDKNDSSSNLVNEIPETISSEKPNSKLNTNAKDDQPSIAMKSQECKKQKSTGSNNMENNFPTDVVKSNTISATQPVKMAFLKKGALYQANKEQDNSEEIKAINTVKHKVNTNTVANDDIEITIRVGNTITNIYIKKKNDVDLKVYTDQEIQTSCKDNILNSRSAPSHEINTQNVVINLGESNNHTIAVNTQSTKDNKKLPAVDKVISPTKGTSEKTKKNTASAETSTAQFEITESVEKELSKVMEDVESDERNKSKSDEDNAEIKSHKEIPRGPVSNQDDLDYLNDLDIFESESLKEANVQSLKNTEHAPSEIFVSTVRTKNRTQKQTEKRDREDEHDDSLPNSKKAKLGKERAVNETIEQNNANPTDSEPMNYDSIMGKVFASIDADMEQHRQSQHIDKSSHKSTQNSKDLNKTNDNERVSQNKDLLEIDSSVKRNDYCNQKESENVFSICVDKEDQNVEVAANEVLPPSNVEEFLTPVTRNNQANDEAVIIDDDDSDKSVVEETPQKTSFTKPKQKNALNEDNQSKKGSSQKEIPQKKSADSNTQVINLTDTSLEMSSVKDNTVIDTANKMNLETPLNINKFVNQVTYKSTPVARKSLNFDTDNNDDIDPEQTLCPTNDVAKTTQEKEFLSKAFERTPTSQAIRPGKRNLGLKNKKFFVAGSCLTAAELTKLKLLCARNKWTYSDKYSSELTHLVVGVDEENRSQRSVKYMCALASSIWIITYAWVEQCLENKEVVNEEVYEALDNTGEAGPRRSRLATKKLFQGITFYCMEPFSMLDVHTFKGMLVSSGGRVVNEVDDVKVTESTSTPALLLAEPENTLEDKYMYLAMQRSVVPVNYEWALNCLGSYTLTTVRDLLLCPAELLPKATLRWPQELLASDED